VRAHIPNQPSFGSGRPDTSYRSPAVRTIVAFLIIVAFLSVMLWMAVRFVIGFL
jgi:uncharacterized membrane-anchored protein